MKKQQMSSAEGSPRRGDDQLKTVPCCSFISDLTFNNVIATGQSE